MVKESSQTALERFFPKIKQALHMSQQAFSLARQKIKWEAFLELFRASVRGSYNETLKYWWGFLLMVIDSSHIALPKDAALGEYYGATGHEHSTPTTRASIMYDIENDIIVDAKTAPLSEDEGSLAKEHIEVLTGMREELGERKGIVICDRGYPSKAFIKYLEDKRIRFVMRVQKGFNPLIDKMAGGSNYRAIRGNQGTGGSVYAEQWREGRVDTEFGREGSGGSCIFRTV
jgi:hypothetical protein